MIRDREWLNQTSEAFFVVSTLVASMASPNVAENLDQKNYSSIVALSLSLTSTNSFLGILALHSQSLNFWRWVPVMLHIAIFAMFGSIVSLWISPILRDHSLKFYAFLGLPIVTLSTVSLPIFIGLMLRSMIAKVPPPSRKTISAIRYRRPKKEENGTDLDRGQKPTQNPAFRGYDPLQDIRSSMPRPRSKKMKEALQALISEMLEMEAQLKDA